MNLRGKLEIAASSDVGLKRNHNEDSVGSDTGIGLAVLLLGLLLGKEAPSSMQCLGGAMILVGSAGLCFLHHALAAHGDEGEHADEPPIESVIDPDAQL